jgi:ubiquinone/menaquinone biosynthesis C-methylase UbiE
MVRAIQFPVQAFIWLFLSPRRGSVGNLTPDEVMSVYDREARRYDAKHHFTTRGQDTVWRREAAWCVLNSARNHLDRIRVLDLCTGTGLTVVEIVSVLALWNLSAEITGVDLNEEMLAIARKRSFPATHANLIRFVQADVTKTRELPRNIDIVTQVFGIGGVPHPKPAFEAVLESLNETGLFYLVDMHRPIPELPGEMPLLWRWWKTPLLEAATYLHTTMPLALARLWGWRDTTLDFYLAPLVTARDQRGTWYGFEIVWFKHEAERWWFGLPVMPTARLLLKKVSLTSEEVAQRRAFLRSLEIYALS